jgi:hypothetical protein
MDGDRGQVGGANEAEVTGAELLPRHVSELGVVRNKKQVLYLVEVKGEGLVSTRVVVVDEIQVVLEGLERRVEV